MMISVSLSASFNLVEMISCFVVIPLPAPDVPKVKTTRENESLCYRPRPKGLPDGFPSAPPLLADPSSGSP